MSTYDKILDAMQEMILKNVPKAKGITIERTGMKQHKKTITSIFVVKFKEGRKEREVPVDAWIEEEDKVTFDSEFGNVVVALR